MHTLHLIKLEISHWTLNVWCDFYVYKKEVQKMKKSNLITGILYVLFGVVCLIVALLIETKLEGILWGFAGEL